MSTPTFNQTQRNAYENSLREKLREARNTFDAKRADAEDEAVQGILMAHGLLELANEATALKQQFVVAEKNLEEEGFEFDHDGFIRIAYGAPEAIKDEREEFIAKQTKVEQSKVDAIQEALTNAWQISNVEQAKAMVATIDSVI